MKRLTLLALLSLSLSPLPAFAQDANAPEAKSAVDPKSPDAMRCRRIDVTGSLVKKERICKTNAEWARIADQNNRNARDTVGSGNVCAGGPMCNGQ